MVINALKINVDITDRAFDKIYPFSVRQRSKVHWSPVQVAKKAASLLVDRPGTKVLDSGSGAGKFCLIGAVISDGLFIGVEQRKNLVDVSNSIFSQYGISNAQAIHANILSIDFREYDAFYFYNPFMENLCVDQRIDSTVSLSEKHYETYVRYVHNQLMGLPNGTKVVTYSSNGLKIPLCYRKKETYMDGLLELWVKNSGYDYS
ncbi:MAG: methyltransferase domain-containing protein [Cyclobacteriaceae bacterium]